MEGMLRRPSGVYVARLTVPVRHRDALGKRFFVKSTGTRVLSVARILVGLILAEWRQKFHELDQMTDTIDARRVVTGDAALLATRYHPIQQAAEVSGLSVHHLLREAATDRLDLFIRIAGVNGYFFQPEAEDYEHEVVGDQLNTVLIVPTKEQLAVDGPPRPMTGLLKLRDPVHYANCLISGTEDSLMTGEIVGRNGLHFVPMDGVDVSVVNLEVDGLQVERLRSTLALSVTPEQVQLAHTALLVKQATAGSTEKISVVINRYMVHRSKSCRSDQARRVRGACDLLSELVGDYSLPYFSRSCLRDFMVGTLPRIPARENKVRLRRGTKSIAESIEAVKGTDWPSISINEQVKRMQWIGEFFAWCVKEDIISKNPADGLTKEIAGGVRSRAPKAQKTQKRRLPFEPEDLNALFSFHWWRSGKGQVTRKGTFREWQPHYSWLPLLGLFTGGRIRELSQIELTDIRCTDQGTLYIDINDIGSDDEDDDGYSPLKSVKTIASVRKLPVHPFLLDLGFSEWVGALRSAGYKRLFPELKGDAVKGFGKAPTKWFSGFLERSFGWERDGKKVFHSFRHTLVTKMMHMPELKTMDHVRSQISGHARMRDPEEGYIHDLKPDALYPLYSLITFDLPYIAPFDIEAGLKSIEDALGRKQRKGKRISRSIGI